MAQDYGDLINSVKGLRTNLDTFYKTSETANDPSYNNIFGLIKKGGSMPGVTETALPAISSLLAPGGQALNPFEKSLRMGTAQDVAGVQSDAMRRGITGSDIEMSGMVGARGKGEDAVANLYGQTAGKLSDFISQAVSGDINAQRENLMMLAQAFGQKIQSDQDLMMFRQQLSASMDMASSANKTALWGAGIGAAGSIAGGAARGMATPSDSRLKTDVRKLEKVGHVDVIAFKWNDKAKKMGAPDGDHFGVMADQIEKLMPEAVGRFRGYRTVKYGMLPDDVLESIKKNGGKDA